MGLAQLTCIAYMAVHAVPMMSREAIRWSFDAATEIPARPLGLEGYGVDVGCYADFVVLRTADPLETIRLRADRLMVVRRGKVIAEAPAQVTRLFLPGRPAHLDLIHYAPKIAQE